LLARGTQGITLAKSHPPYGPKMTTITSTKGKESDLIRKA